MNFRQFEEKHEVQVGDQIHLNRKGIEHVNRLLRLLSFKKTVMQGDRAVYGKRGFLGLYNWLLVYTDTEKLRRILVGRRHKILEDKEPTIPYIPAQK